MQISIPEAFANVLRPVYRELKHEECFFGGGLNKANRIIQKEMLFKGGPISTILDVKTIVRKALLYSSSAVIISHYHPYGSANPSPADIEQTDTLYKALKYMEISLLDHVIICEDSFYSLMEQESNNF